jgi:hypothetical protein
MKAKRKRRYYSDGCYKTNPSYYVSLKSPDRVWKGVADSKICAFILNSI